MKTESLNEEKLHEIWTKAVRLHAQGQRDPQTLFAEDERAFLEQLGLTAQDVYDFAEDYNDDGEPDFVTFKKIHDLRYSYFLKVQQGKRSKTMIDPETLPPREAEAGGMPWLPRIIAKAKAKLRGELDPAIMYCCGGDRAFLRKHQIHPVEFLGAVWENEDDDQAIVDWVKRHSKEANGGGSPDQTLFQVPEC